MLRSPTSCVYSLHPFVPSKKLSTSTPAQDADCDCVVTQASSDHPRWRGPHPAGPWLALAAGCGSCPLQNLFSPIFSGEKQRPESRCLYKLIIRNKKVQEKSQGFYCSGFLLTTKQTKKVKPLMRLEDSDDSISYSKDFPSRQNPSKRVRIFDTRTGHFSKTSSYLDGSNPLMTHSNLTPSLP